MGNACQKVVHGNDGFGKFRRRCARAATHRDGSGQERLLCPVHFRDWWCRVHGQLPSEGQWWHHYLGGGDERSFDTHVGGLPEGWMPLSRNQRRKRNNRAPADAGRAQQT